MRSIRLLPLVLVAGGALFLLKMAGLYLDGGYVLTGVAPARAQSQTDKQEVPKSPPAAEKDAAAENDGKLGKTAEDSAAPPPSGGRQITLSQRSKSEIALLERLGDRRKALDARAREIDLRENLIKAAEKKIEKRIGELKAIEAKIEKAFVKREKEQKAQYVRLVKMYQNMKPKDAARIFNRLDLDVLIGVVKNMKPRTMAPILAKMDSDVAQRMTMQIATQKGMLPKPPRQEARQSPTLLPKIQGKKRL